MPIDPIREASTAMINALYNVKGPLKWYTEAALSGSAKENTSNLKLDGPLSFTGGPLLETRPITVRGNYVYQTASYLPLLGYYLGDRRGSFGEVRVRPVSRLELYGSASDYRNNIAGNALRPTFRSTAKSVGISLQLLRASH